MKYSKPKHKTPTPAVHGKTPRKSVHKARKHGVSVSVTDPPTDATVDNSTEVAFQQAQTRAK